MNTYRPKPSATVEAALWTGGPEAATPIIDWILRNGGRSARYHEAEHFTNTEGRQELLCHDCINIDLHAGMVDANPGDWIVRLPGGLFVPMKPADFEALFETAAGQLCDHMIGLYDTGAHDRIVVRASDNRVDYHPLDVVHPFCPCCGERLPEYVLPTPEEIEAHHAAARAARQQYLQDNPGTAQSAFMGLEDQVAKDVAEYAAKGSPWTDIVKKEPWPENPAIKAVPES